VDELAALNPTWSGPIRRLLPAVADLAKIGKGQTDGGVLERPGGPGGRAFGEFRIVREVGRGGMGIVYEALQLGLDRPVALKVLSLAAAMDPRALQRFQLEAQVAGWLHHPRIVPVHAVGVVDDVPYYAMQFIEGISLAGLIAEMRNLVNGSAAPLAKNETGLNASSLATGFLSGSFQGGHESGIPHRRRPREVAGPPPTETNVSIRTSSYIRTVVRLGIQAAEALGYAHDQGIVHRDIKPANLLLDRNGDVWVTDFGMADVQGGAGLTMTGDLPGTLRYMSPEQARGRRDLVDRRSDVYSLGATLYELLALQPAVACSDRAEILHAVAEEEPILIRRLNPIVPIDLATIVAKAMRKEPSTRYDTAWELAEDLVRYAQGLPIAARPIGPVARCWRWCRRKPLAAALAASLILALTGGIGGITWNWREAVRQSARATHERDQKEAQRALAEAAGEEARTQTAHAEAAGKAARQQATRAEASEKKARIQAAKADAINRFLVDKLLRQVDPNTNPIPNRVTLLEVLDRAAGEVGLSFPGQPEIEASIRLAISRAYHRLMEYAKAEAHARAAYGLLRDRHGEIETERLEAMMELGHTLRHLDRFDEAEPLLRRAVGETRDILGPSHDLSLEAAGHLADLLFVQRKLSEAEDAYRRVVKESRIIRGPKHNVTLTFLSSLGSVLTAEHKHDEAERVLREVLSLSHEALGAHHVTTVSTRGRLAHLLTHMGRADEAIALQQSQVAALREILGPDHQVTIEKMTILGSLLQHGGRLLEAESMLRACLDGQKRTLGADHAETLATAKRLDVVVKKLAQAPTAVPSPAATAPRAAPSAAVPR
jgi:serine/threonine protein kinase